VCVLGGGGGGGGGVTILFYAVTILDVASAR
jgi:hypothetical protein